MDPMSEKRQVNKPQETGMTVAINLRRLRGQWTYKELSERLAERGRRIAPLMLRKIEDGERNVTVDDLMAFSLVYGVSPLTILLPDYKEGSEAEITGLPEEVPTEDVWAWALGNKPLGGHVHGALPASIYLGFSGLENALKSLGAPGGDWSKVARDMDSKTFETYENAMKALHPDGFK